VSWLHAVLDVPDERHTAAAAFWGRVFGWPAGAPWPGHPELSSFEPPSGTSYVHLQRIDGPPRVHLDVESADPTSTVARAVHLGAEPVAQHDAWSTLRSPGGLRFCVIGAAEHRAPPPATHPDGHRSRLVQVCVDSPQPTHATEVAFWRELLAGRWVASGDPEFAGKWHDDAGSPIQLLFQELDETDGPVRAHLDLGTDDLPGEVGRLVRIGAADVGPGRGWHVLCDVTGQRFCVTENSPEQTTRRDLGSRGRATRVQTSGQTPTGRHSDADH
jgi:Glyoxalase-like domain